MTELTKQQQEQAEELLARALELEADAQLALFESSDAAQAVINEVKSLLGFQEAAFEQIDSPVVTPNVVVEAVDALHGTDPSDSVPAPETIGPYRILEKLGEGGMGTVYLAEQEKPLKRRVALKLIKLGMDTRGVIARFEAERQALALMSHPNVARALDAGSTEGGKPYFVMEYVDGIRITEYCDTKRLDIPARLALFSRVCEAIQHAHQKGIIHRDIKPSNVIVTQENGEAVPKVIDFGVAKATNQRLTEQTLFTEQGVLIGTPEYMSPEQAGTDSKDVDTRSDVYSLGVLLYELLVGALPIDTETLRKAGLDELHRLIRDQDPPKPTTRLSDLGDRAAQNARQRGTDLSTLRRKLRGDLDWIVMKCLEKDRNRRYAATAELIDDLKRYVQHKPVSAGPPSMRYRARKYVRRHRTMLTSFSILFAGLSTATAVSTTMYFDARTARVQAEQERRTAQTVSNFVQEMLGSIDPQVAQGRDVTLIREVLDSAADRLDSELASEPIVAAELHHTIGSAYHSIGQHAQAEMHLRRALEIRKDTSLKDPLVLAGAHASLGNLLRQMSQFEEAEPLLREALAIKRREIGASSLEVAKALYDLGILCEQTGSPETEPMYRQALDIYRLHSHETTPAMARTLHALAIFLRNRSRIDEAEELMRQALSIQRERFGEDHPDVIPMALGVGACLRASKQYAEADKHMLEALRIARKNLSSDHPKLLNVLSNLAALYQDMGDYEAAEPMYRETLEIQRRVHGRQHLDTATTTNNLASLLFVLEKLDDAEPLFREAADAYRAVLGPDHYWVSIALLNVALIREARRDFDAVEEIVAECLRIRRQAAAPAAWALAEIETIKGACVTARGDYEGAERLLLASLPELRKKHGENGRSTKETRRRLAELYEAWGNPDEASRWRSVSSE